jgi:hypothetical protein
MNAAEIRAAADHFANNVGKLNPTHEGKLIDAVAVLAQFTAEVAAQLAELNTELRDQRNEARKAMDFAREAMAKAEQL